MGDRVAMPIIRVEKKYKTNPQKAESKTAEKKARQEILPLDIDPIKARAAEIFKAKCKEAKNHPRYQKLKREHQEKYEL